MFATLWTRVTRKSNRLTAAYLVAGGLFIAVYFAAGLAATTQDVIYQIPGMAAPIAVAVGILRYRPADKRPWIVLAAGLGLTTFGDWTWLALAELGVETVPSIADALYLGGLALTAFAVLALVRGRIPGGDGAGFIDALIVAIGAALLSWTFLMRPLVEDPFASIPEVATALAYPVVDILLLAVLVRLMLVPGRRGVALNLILLALISLLLSDIPYAVMTVAGGYETGHIVELGWLAASVLWGAAALHPSMAHVADPVESAEARLPAWRLALLAGASLMAPAVLVIEAATGRPIDVAAVAAGSVLLFLLVIARLGGVVRDLRATLHERQALESELERRALHDPLTGLANRVLLHDRLEHALARRGQQVAILFLDLDDFKSVNDTSGHHVGDALLTSVADAIGRSVRAGDTVARLGGDEFAVLVDSEATVERASDLAQRVLTAIAAPIEVGGRERSTSASVGIAVGASGVTTAETLMREADIAMYVAKGEGKGRATVFDPGRHEVVVRSMGLQSDMERALAERQFELHYQPIV
ncbi:MAG TPA: GGDEF domain-containing protein, partial [Candidatus Limnocylindria bacterium]